MLLYIELMAERGNLNKNSDSRVGFFIVNVMFQFENQHFLTKFVKLKLILHFYALLFL